ncbi:bifunctional TH2 protein, mitochondrial-like isoform X2 [Rhodamnia argentea]|uniref:Bifunctional TH2 protein, mitochondrial-like isoform X2 n=1 Tax=Rhodamnia argentea TaxID=178133 RepID=A0ABM3GU67_9MYRT|nr:bifunctional TH2 protein, mitochondrial-like isoform X2 [Rhodamnia argentea]
MIKLCKLRIIVLEEMVMHDSFLQEWGLDVTKDATPDPATANCTEFLLGKGVVNLKTPLEKTIAAIFTLGALTPSVQLCPFLAAELRMLPSFRADSHPYRNWIKMYTSESHQELAVKTEELLEKLSVTLTGDGIDVLYNLYHQAMILEIDLFNSQPFAQPTVVPVIKGLSTAEDRLMFLSNFDLTCTVHDSSATLAEMTLGTAPKSDCSPSGSEHSPSESPLARMSLSELRNMWKDISKQYTQDYEECIESIIPPEKVEFNHSSLVQALEQVADFEKKANSRVIKSGVLRGLKLEDIIKAGKNLILQDGCIGFYQKLTQINVVVNVHMLSYCWCGDLIRSSLSSVGFDHSNVHANELIFNEERLSTGEMVLKVESPIEKLQIYNHILKNDADERNKLTVYVGDCMGDILCLIEADIGIVIGSSESLRRVGSRFGVTFAPLFAATVRKQKEVTDGGSLKWKGTRSGVLYTVSCWAEIHAFLLGW